MCVALLALVLALDGPALAKIVTPGKGPNTTTPHSGLDSKPLIHGRDIASNAITSPKIKDHSIGSVDIANGVISKPGYSMAQSDDRYVRKVPGSPNQATDAAALGGKPAAAFLDKTDSDARYVNIVPGSTNQAPNAAALQGHPASDFPLRGTDITGPLMISAGSVPANGCLTEEVTIFGAQPGDLPIIGFVGNAVVPAGLTFELLKVLAVDTATLRICNATSAAAPTATANLTVRVITFR